jgi:RHS repeat-associated protein
MHFTGREEDPDTGLYYFRNRYADLSVGGFISEDPLGFKAGINFYVYVNNNPVNANDPYGHIAETPWDILNIGLGAYSLQSNIRSGNWGWAALDVAGLAYDSVAAAVPFLPAGASAGLKAFRAGNSVVHSAQVGMDVASAAKVANTVARTAELSGDAAKVGRAIHREVGAVLEEGNMLSASANNFLKGANRATGRQPDLSWSNAPGIWADLTTVGEWGKHVTTYGSLFGEGIPLLYQAGQGLVKTTELTPFMGSLFTGGQQLFGEATAEAAGGGFVLYPNKPNTNMMQSIYGK